MSILIEIDTKFEVHFNKEHIKGALTEKKVVFSTLRLAEVAYGSALAKLLIDGTEEYNFIALSLMKISYYSNGTKEEETLADYTEGEPRSIVFF